MPEIQTTPYAKEAYRVKVHVPDGATVYTSVDEMRWITYMLSLTKGAYFEVGVNEGLTCLQAASTGRACYGIDCSLDYYLPNQVTERPFGRIGRHVRSLPNVKLFDGLFGAFDLTQVQGLSTVFIDGNHVYSHVKDDTEKVLSYAHSSKLALKPFALIWHDYYAKDGEPWVGVSAYLKTLPFDVRHVSGTRLAYTVLS